MGPGLSQTHRWLSVRCGEDSSRSLLRFISIGNLLLLVGRFKLVRLNRLIRGGRRWCSRRNKLQDQSRLLFIFYFYTTSIQLFVSLNFLIVGQTGSLFIYSRPFLRVRWRDSNSWPYNNFNLNRRRLNHGIFKIFNFSQSNILPTLPYF